MSSLHLGLVHYPVYNKKNEVIQTSVTNLDIHDIARSALSFGVSQYFVITPDTIQQDYVRKVKNFWLHDSGQAYNSERSRALEIIKITDSIESCINQITTQEGTQPIVISTTARSMHQQVTSTELGNLLNNEKSLLILFGTGYGLTDAILNSADYILEPIQGKGEYNHLSVRSAAAIVLDRVTSAVYKGRN